MRVGGTHVVDRGARTVAALVAAATAGALLAGCAVGEAHRAPDEVAASVEDAGEQASSAVETVTTAVDLAGRGRLTLTVASTAQADSVRVLEEATRTLTTLAPPDRGTGAARDVTLAAVQDATAAVVAAGDWVAASGSAQGVDRSAPPTAVLAALDDAGAALDRAVTVAAGAGS